VRRETGRLENLTDRLRGGEVTRASPIVVLDGEQRAALAIARSLGRHGYPVHVGSNTRKSLAGGSRYAASETILPDPLAAPAAFASAAATLIDARKAEVLIPVTDASSLAVLQHPELFVRVRVPSSDAEHFRRASDKALVLSAAQQVGIDVPSQWVVLEKTSRSPDIPPERFPVVLKPSRSVSGPEGERVKLGVSYARTPDELSQALQKLPPAAFPLLIQERIQGPGLAVFLLRWRGTIRAVFAHRRIREFPPSGGVSVCAESVSVSERLVERSEALLAALDWSGVAMVEFKRDERSGREYLMEVNPRFWGSLQLAIDAGVDFPWYLVRLALGEEVNPVREWRVGISNRWGWGEMNHLIARLRHSREDLGLPPGTPGIGRAVLDAMTVWRPGQRGAVFRFSDPVPSVRESIAWVRDVLA
jgi:predicted ATP-grasp superfamily ATP-dependent carboligase